MASCFMCSKSKGDAVTLLVTDPKKFEITTHSKEIVAAVIGAAASNFGVLGANSAHIKIVFSDVELSRTDTVEGAGMCDQSIIQLTGLVDARRAQAMTNALDRIRENIENRSDYNSFFKVVVVICFCVVTLVIIPFILYFLLGSDCDANFLEVRSGLSCGFKLAAGIISVIYMGLCFSCVCWRTTYADN
jgi:hypothetical protein